jgi:hypothetical protein
MANGQRKLKLIPNRNDSPHLHSIECAVAFEEEAVLASSISHKGMLQEVNL